MEVKFTRSKWGTILWGIACILLGIVMFVHPGTTMLTVTTIAGWVLTVFGILSLVSAFTHWSIILSSIDLYSGALALLFGLLILAWPEAFVAWIFILLGIWIMVSGFSALMGANALHVMGAKGSGWAIAAAILTIVFGILVVMAPFSMAGVAVSLCGVALVYTGVVHLIDGIKMPKETR